MLSLSSIIIFRLLGQLDDDDRVLSLFILVSFGKHVCFIGIDVDYSMLKLFGKAKKCC